VAAAIHAWPTAAPGCLPGRCVARSAARRSTRLSLRNPSEEGGLDELEASLPSRHSSSATRACSAAIRRACSALTAARAALAARNSTMTAAWTATVASGSREAIAASRTTSGQARLPMGPDRTATPAAALRSTGRSRHGGGSGMGWTRCLARNRFSGTRRPRGWFPCSALSGCTGSTRRLSLPAASAYRRPSADPLSSGSVRRLPNRERLKMARRTPTGFDSDLSKAEARG
jgi:hypothetical protein